jgi:hypothetical protein
MWKSKETEPSLCNDYTEVEEDKLICQGAYSNPLLIKTKNSLVTGWYMYELGISFWFNDVTKEKISEEDVLQWRYVEEIVE